MSSAICFDLDKSKVLSSGNGLKEIQQRYCKCPSFSSQQSRQCQTNDKASPFFEKTVKSKLELCRKHC